MKNLVLLLIIAGILSLVSCSNDQKIITEENLVIPNDAFAFYIIEGVHEHIDLNTITLDSIKKLENRIIDYKDLVSYDTSNFVFELIGVSKLHIDSILFARYALRYPLAAVSKGQILFYVYLNHPALSSTPNYYFLEPSTLPLWVQGYLYFCIPPSENIPGDKDHRKNSTMLQIFESDNKLI